VTANEANGGTKAAITKRSKTQRQSDESDVENDGADVRARKLKEAKVYDDGAQNGAERDPAHSTASSFDLLSWNALSR